MICGLQTNEQSVARHETVVFTIYSICSFSLIAVGIFRILQGKLNAPYLWLELKTTNNAIVTALCATMVMFQYPLALMVCAMLLVLRFTYCLVP